MIDVAAAVIIRNGKVLLASRPADKPPAGWEFPGGKLEYGESVADAAVRELQEELGLSPDRIMQLQLRYVTLRHTGDELRQNYYFFAQLSGEPILPSTEGITKWFSFAEVSALPMPFTARWVIEHYIRTGRYDDRLYGGIANESGVTFIEL